MINRIRFNVCERFSTRIWAKYLHVLLPALWLSSSLFSLCNFYIKDKILTNKHNSNFKKIPVFILTLLFCLFCFSIVVSGVSSAATVYVAGDGSGTYNCDRTNDHVEINRALAYIDSVGGGTVYLKGPNTY